MTVAFAITETLWGTLTQALEDDRELAGVLATALVRHSGGITLLARNVTWASQDAYTERRSDGLSLSSHGWVPPTRRAIAQGELPIFLHTHPSGRAEFSLLDDEVDAQLRESYTHMAKDATYASLIMAGTPTDPHVVCRLFTDGAPQYVDKYRIVGDRVTIVHASRFASKFNESVFDRQVRAFGPSGQAILASLHVAVVGAGGTGSAVAEQMARLGVGAITIVDDDVVTPPTPTRGYGMTVRDVGRPKATVLAEHLRGIGMGTEVSDVAEQVQHRDARNALGGADVVFSCVDGHGARLILNRWAYAHLSPVIDLGVLISASGGTVDGIDGRVTWLSPGTACLLCRSRLDPALAYAEMLAPEERRRLAGEGYARAADTQQPAVVTLTTYVAALAATELLLRLFALADSTPSEIIALIRDRGLRLNRTPQRPGCFCSDLDFVGRGTREPHLDLVWT